MSGKKDSCANLVGVGLDNSDGQVRITRGKNFHLFGGSHETHERMQEQCTIFNEKLDSRGKRLQDLEHKEFIDIASECDMPILAFEKNNRGMEN